MLIGKKNLLEIKNSIYKIRSFLPLLILMEIFSWVGTLGSSYSIYLIPVSVGKGISSTQPIFVLIFALLFSKLRPKFFNEYLGKDGVIKKVILFTLTIFGVLLIT